MTVNVPLNKVLTSVVAGDRWNSQQEQSKHTNYSLSSDLFLTQLHSLCTRSPSIIQRSSFPSSKFLFMSLTLSRSVTQGVCRWTMEATKYQCLPGDMQDVGVGCNVDCDTVIGVCHFVSTERWQHLKLHARHMLYMLYVTLWSTSGGVHGKYMFVPLPASPLQSLLVWWQSQQS